MTAFQERWQHRRARADAALDARLPAATEPPARLHEAMRYCCLNGGKRLRAMLVYAGGEIFGAPEHMLDVPACAVELIHAYSLVHDDLPAMDDDDLRRGRPTCHRAYDEATAILVGDALLTLAFAVLTADPALNVAPERRLRMLDSLAAASGSRGMVGGQARDLAAVGRSATLEELQTMHLAKTGALIRASVTLGALTGEADDAALLALDRYACHLGLAFQIVDDVLDEESDTGTLGKRSGADRALNKPTYTSVLGVEGARTAARERHAAALDALAGLTQDTAALRELADFVVERKF